MRVLIVNPAQKVPILLDAVICRCSGIERKAGERLAPIGLAYIASTLRAAEHEVNLIDCAVNNLLPANLVESIRKSHPRMVISIASKKTETSDLQYLQKAKEHDCITVLCGSYPTVDAARILQKNAEIDFIILGEPEHTALELTNAIELSKSVCDIPGIAYKKQGRVSINKKRALLPDLNQLPFPARDYLQNSSYTSPYSKYGVQTVVISSRGCAHACTFCSKNIYYNNTYRHRSARNTVDELEDAQKRYGIHDFSFQDDDFTQNRRRTLEICHELERRQLNIAWQCTSRVDGVDPELLRNMKKAGCYLIKYGIESGDEIVLKKMRKAVHLEQIEKAVYETKKAGILSGGTFILGSPWDTTKTMLKTALFAGRLPLDYASFSIFERLDRYDIPVHTKPQTKACLLTAYLLFYMHPHRLRSYLKEQKNSINAARSILRYLIKKCSTQ